MIETQTIGIFTSKEKGVNVIILKINNPELCIGPEPSYELDLLGKPIYSWVADACRGRKITYVETSQDADIISLITPYLDDSAYTMVLYCDTPLLSPKTILSVLDYVIAKDMQVCKLERGYVFNTEYLRSATKIYAPQTYNFNTQDFMAVTNFGSLALVRDVLRQRINAFHMANGVNIIDPKSTYIEAPVKIGRGVTICQNSVIKGQSVISEGCYVRENCVIRDSVMFKGSQAIFSIIDNSIIMEDANVINSTVINSSVVKAKATIVDAVLNGVKED